MEFHRLQYTGDDCSGAYTALKEKHIFGNDRQGKPMPRCNEKQQSVVQIIRKSAKK